MTLKELNKKAQALQKNYVSVTRKIAQQKRNVLIQLQVSQTLSGRDKLGKLLSPTYEADPFFTTPKSAKRYQDKKTEYLNIHNALRYTDVIFPVKPVETPNLIYGEWKKSKYLKGVKLAINGDNITFESTWAKAPRVDAKYPTAMGLAQETRLYFWQHYVRQELVDYFYSV